jgi:hypothetical protein
MRKVLKINKVKLKAFVDFGLVIVFSISVLSGIVLRQMPGGVYRGGKGILTATSFLGISRRNWNEIHYNFQLLFIFLIIFHLLLNLESLKNSFRLINNFITELVKRKPKEKKVID